MHCSKIVFHLSPPGLAGLCEPHIARGIISAAERPSFLCTDPLFLSQTNGHNIGGGLPDFFVGKHVSRCRHTHAATLAAIGNGLEHIARIGQIAFGEVDAAVTVRAVAVRAVVGCRKRSVRSSAPPVL
jgi:hypothetical protein